MSDKIKFVLDGCDISFFAEAPKDMTLEQLLKQCNRIKPHWCACGIRSQDSEQPAEIIFDYDDVKKADEDVSCWILPNGERWFQMKDTEKRKGTGAGGGLGFCSTLQIVFIVLKLRHVINWSWLWILSPTWISIILAIIMVVFLLLPAITNQKRRK